MKYISIKHAPQKKLSARHLEACKHTFGKHLRKDLQDRSLRLSQEILLRAQKMAEKISSHTYPDEPITPFLEKALDVCLPEMTSRQKKDYEQKTRNHSSLLMYDVLPEHVECVKDCNENCSNYVENSVERPCHTLSILGLDELFSIQLCVLMLLRDSIYSACLTHPALDSFDNGDYDIVPLSRVEYAAFIFHRKHDQLVKKCFNNKFNFYHALDFVQNVQKEVRSVLDTTRDLLDAHLDPATGPSY